MICTKYFTTKDQFKLIDKLVQDCDKLVLDGLGLVQATYGMAVNLLLFWFISFWSKNRTEPDF